MENQIGYEARPEVETEAMPKPKRERIRLLKVPIDIVEPEDLDLLVFSMVNEQQEYGIVLLSIWDLLRARRNAEYRDFVNQAVLVIPISKSIVAGAWFLLKKRPVRYMPFDFVIRCLSVLEKHEFSCYMLGGKKRVLLKIEKNIASTFPGLRIVGRFHGSFKRQEELAIISAIRKSAPSLLLVGKKVRGGELWLARNTGRLGNGLRLWCSDLFDVLAERKWRPPRKVFDLGLEWVGYCLRNPLKLLRFFPFMYYNLLLLLYKIFRKGGMV
ncbi:MAG: WecB/TagA/CpsF family glycosyltransferase [Treponema sp.]|nr:WecB/TagA/CpsF family glycosyltransferase [Treponema sp.]